MLASLEARLAGADIPQQSTARARMGPATNHVSYASKLSSPAWQTAHLPHSHPLGVGSTQRSVPLPWPHAQLIYRGSYHIPDGVEVSASCQDLLDRIFEPDPQRRTTLAAIQRHPWFRRHLPDAVTPQGGGSAPRRARRPCWLCFCGSVGAG